MNLLFFMTRPSPVPCSILSPGSLKVSRSIRSRSAPHSFSSSHSHVSSGTDPGDSRLNRKLQQHKLSSLSRFIKLWSTEPSTALLFMLSSFITFITWVVYCRLKSDWCYFDLDTCDVALCKLMMDRSLTSWSQTSTCSHRVGFSHSFIVSDSLRLI